MTILVAFMAGIGSFASPHAPYPPFKSENRLHENSYLDEIFMISTPGLHEGSSRV